MKKVLLILLLIILAFSCVSCTSSKENYTDTSSKENYMTANEIKTHVIHGLVDNGYDDHDNLNKQINDWLLDHRNAKIIEIQYSSNEVVNGHAFGSVLIIYERFSDHS